MIRYKIIGNKACKEFKMKMLYMWLMGTVYSAKKQF